MWHLFFEESRVLNFKIKFELLPLALGEVVFSYDFVGEN